MDTNPLVSIVIPVFNDAEVITAALDSCLAQTLTAIEVIVVDDASTDDTAAVIERYAAADDRIRLVRQAQNSSAFQARRVGILTARADHLMFLDGDDELGTDAAAVVLAKARETHADLVQFGIDVVNREGRTGGRFEARLQPRHTALRDFDVLRGLFPLDTVAQGQLWKYLFRRQLLLDAYALMPDDLILPRVNDLPIAFLAAALATSYASVPDRLYRYHFGRGGSGQKVRDLETASFYAGAIRSIDSISPAVTEIARSSATPDAVLATYASVRRAIIGYTTHYLAEHTRADLLADVFADLYSRASARDIVQSTAQHWPDDVDTLAAHPGGITLPERPVRSIVLATNHLRTGGISGVIISQARVLHEAGYRVTVVAREPGSDRALVPAGVDFAEVSAAPLGAALAEWSRVCASHEVDLVVEHQWQYSTAWQAFALAARADGVATIGWSHNFAGRSILFGLGRLESAPRYFALLSHLVVLSPLDVAFWKLRGMPRVSYLPNPPSSLLLDAGLASAPRPAPHGRRLELIWWGRLQERGKRVTELIDVAEQLARLGVDFRLRIVGPDWRDMSAARLNAMARERGLGQRVLAVGPLRGQELIAAIDSSDVFVNTSVIEGYPLTIPEAQSRGLPVAMYELPWLTLTKDNGGVVTAPQSDAAALATRIAAIAADPELYTRMSAASVAAAQRELDYDFVTAYAQLVAGTLSAEHSPEPTLDDAQRLIDLTIDFAEQRSRSIARAARPESAATSPSRSATGRDSVRGKIVDKARRAAEAVLDIAPWLRPAAQTVKRRLLRG
ncbi:glycosyltransferase [Microbacterium lacticum]|uniref:glycosyltransferase n=1 Tax=Microbacterium lacticum TaxID=33885 RepID=UPI001F5AB8FB|nr:glycosyltransferase [Microbacterium lacticum]